MSDELRMNAYYFSFEPTGARSVDRILSAVACAGKAFHYTEDWTSACGAYMSETRGDSCREWIQNAATEAASERAELLSALTEAQDFFAFHFDASPTAATATTVNQGDVNRLRDLLTAALAKVTP